MPDLQKIAEREAQQRREIEEHHEALRRSIADAQRLVQASEEMLQRHKREREQDLED